MDAETLERSKRLSRRMARERALSVHFGHGLAAYDNADVYGVVRHRSAIAMLPEGGAESLEFMALDWRAKWLEDRREEALDVARQIAERFPDDADAFLELGHILVDLDRPEEALDVFVAGTRHNEGDADLWYELGLVAERLERWDLRHRAFVKVWQLEHDQEPSHRLYLSEEQFAGLVESTLERLPPMARRALGNVVIFVEDYPEEWVVEGDVGDPRILGLFDGPDRAMEHSVDAVIEGPARIYIYRWNIERTCASLEEVEEQVEITVLHEVGHYLGLDEDALHFRGLG